MGIVDQASLSACETSSYRRRSLAYTYSHAFFEASLVCISGQRSHCAHSATSLQYVATSVRRRGTPQSRLHRHVGTYYHPALITSGYRFPSSGGPWACAAFRPFACSWPSSLTCASWCLLCVRPRPGPPHTAPPASHQGTSCRKRYCDPSACMSSSGLAPVMW